MDQLVTAGHPIASVSAAPTTNVGTKYAGFWRRVAASVLDSLIVTLGTSAASAMAGVTQNDVVISVVSIVNLVVSLAYYIYFIGGRGQTPGKMVLKIKVVRVGGEAKVGYGRAFLREVIGKLVSSLVLGLGYLWMVWDTKKQTWHDKISGTVVIKI